MNTLTKKWTFAFLFIIFMLLGYLFLGKQLYYTLYLDNSIPQIPLMFNQVASQEQTNLALLLEAEIELNRNNPKSAVLNYIEVAKNSQDPNVAERATKLALTYGSEAEMLEPATIWANRAPESIEANLTLIGLLLLKSENEQALPYLKKIISQEKMDLDKSVLALYQQLQDEHAEQLLQKILTDLTLNPEYKNKTEALALHLVLSEIFLIKNQPELAYLHATFLEKAPEMSLPPRAHVIYAQTLYLKGENQKAIAYLNHQIKLAPSENLLRIYLLDSLVEAQEFKQAKIILKQMLTLKTLQNNELLQIAQIALEAQWFKEATLFLMIAKDDEKEGDNAKYFIARIEDINNHTTEAIQWYQQVLNSPYALNSQLRAAVLLSQQNKIQEALSLLAGLEPQTIEEYKKIILTQSQLFIDSKQYEEGYDLLTKALIDLPEDEDILYTRGLQAIYLKRYAQAETDFKDILKLEPNHPKTLNALGYLFIEHLQKPDAGYPYLAKALQIDPNNPAIMDSLGWFYFKKGNKVEALKWLKQAFSLSNDPDISIHLSEVLYAIGEPDSAKKMVSDALLRFPNEPSLIKTQEKFKAVTQSIRARSAPTPKN